MAHDNSHNHNQQQKPQEDIGVNIWWKLPFDPTTNFSLLGYILGGFHWESNLIKRVDLTLNK
ncbi:MAG: hypothetical protein Q8P28_10660 [Deltaproteobacteria bacterium]|nr:hypothetical protein [Deltaproteobacteria bacterium]